MIHNHLAAERRSDMVAKRIICSDRLRRVPKQFSWLDHRLVRDNHIRGISHQALALYLFLVTVSDADGLSYYSEGAIERYVTLDSVLLGVARAELCAAGLIAYRRPLYQVLSLDTPTVTPSAPDQRAQRRDWCGPTSVGDILRQALGGAR